MPIETIGSLQRFFENHDILNGCETLHPQNFAAGNRDYQKGSVMTKRERSRANNRLKPDFEEMKQIMETLSEDTTVMDWVESEKIKETPQPADTSERLTELMKKYKIKLRKQDQIVHHQTYQIEVILTPAQFAIYEGAIKASYTTQFISGGDPMAAMAWYHHIADPNRIVLPYIPSRCFISHTVKPNDHGNEMSRQASNDYHLFAGLARQESVKNRARPTELENMYYATLD